MGIKAPVINLSVVQTLHFNLEENQHNLKIKQAVSRKLSCPARDILDSGEQFSEFCCHVQCTKEV